MTDALPSKPYAPTEAEAAAVAAVKARRRATAKLPKLTTAKTEDGIGELKFEHPDEGVAGAVLMDALGADHADFVDFMMAHMAMQTQVDGQMNAFQMRYFLAAVAGIKPKDHIESMLAVQMVAINNATLAEAARLRVTKNTAAKEASERAVNRLARTFAAQVEALKRYRSKGEQRVYVERVDVRDGGQAIVGNVQGGSGGALKSGS